MKLVTIQRPGAAPEPALLISEGYVPLAATGYSSLLAIIENAAEALPRIAAITHSPIAKAAAKLLPPLPRPPKIICIGLNYRDHAIESNMAIPVTPTVFTKFPTAIIGPGDNIVLPRISTQPDYEAEFAVVIGKGGRHIAAADWRNHVFGYTCLNDVSARDIQLASTQWTMGKTFDTFAPIGPAIVTANEIADPHALDISLTLNGEVMQKSNTRNLIFDIPTLIAYLSSIFTLEPGDIISTGTPAGVGFARKPPVYLKPGDRCVVSIEGIGDLENPVVAEA